MKFRKGQTRLEYLLTYAWAILIIVAVIAVPLIIILIAVYELPSYLGVQSVNLLAILVAFVVGEIMNAVFMPDSSLLRTLTKEFGAGYKKDGKKVPLSGIVFVVILNALFSLVAIYVLALFIRYAQARTIVGGAEIGFLVGLGFRILFSCFTLLGLVLDKKELKGIWEKKELTAHGYGLVRNIIMGIIIAVLS